jgi:small subunit ribosomal protein S7
MARKNRKERKGSHADVRFHNLMIGKFINCMTFDGKKSVSSAVFYEGLQSAAEALGADPVEVFEKAVSNVRPSLEVRSRRVGGATYQVPVEVRPKRSLRLAFGWLIKAARLRKGANSMAGKLKMEFVDAFNNQGAAKKKCEDTHKMAESNKALAYYRW